MVWAALTLFSLLWLRCSGLTCSCRSTDPNAVFEDPYFINCFHDGGLCTGDVCVTTRFGEDFGGDTSYRCLDLSFPHNIATCDGSRNTDNRVSLCCSEDNCNADLNPLFPWEESSDQPSIVTTPPPTLPEMTPEVTSLPTTVVTTPGPTTLQTETTSTPPPTTDTPSDDLITCFCDSTYQLSPNCFEDRTVSCNGRCFQRMFLVEGAVHMDWNCMADLEDEQMLDPCDAGGRLPEQAVVKCCDEKDLCNSDLLTTEPPTTGSPESVTTEELEDGGFASMHYYIISGVVVALGIATVVGVVVLFLYCIHSQQHASGRRKQPKRLPTTQSAMSVHATIELRNVTVL